MLLFIVPGLLAMPFCAMVILAVTSCVAILARFMGSPNEEAPAWGLIASGLVLFWYYRYYRPSAVKEYIKVYKEDPDDDAI